MNAPDPAKALEAEGPVRRYPGTRPFRDQPEEHALFFGRKAEIEQLYLRVLSVSLLVQFSKSGLGKTSLLQAGLFPLLRRKPFLPVMVRLNQEEPLVDTVGKALKSACLAEGLEFTAGEADGLWELLSGMIVWRDDLLLTPVLVFDPFEEVFTLRGKGFREELARELAALASGNPPDRLRAAHGGVAQDRADRPKIHAPKVKIILSLREEYLGALEEFSLAIPQLFEERLRLGPISERGAREAILLPAIKRARADGAPYWSPTFKFKFEAVKGIIAFLKGKSGIIEPFQMQLVCQHAEELAFGKLKAQAQTGPIRLSLADLGGAIGLASILESFYNNTIGKLPKAQRQKARLLCEDGLLDNNGHRLPLDKEQIQSDYKVSEQSLDILIHERLLVREPRLDSVFYEISHDRLAESIQKARPFRLPRRFRNHLLIGGLMGLGILAAVALGWYLTNQERQRIEGLLSFMLGEKLQAEMRNVGRGDIQELVQEKSEQALRGRSFNNGLALRNRGILHRSRGNVKQAEQDFESAQTIFSELVGSEGDRAKIELARTLIQYAQALADSGSVSQALALSGRAVQIRRDIVGLYSDTIPANLLDTYAFNNRPALELAEALDYLGTIQGRMGDDLEALNNYREAIVIAQENVFGTAMSDERSANRGGLESMPNPIALGILNDAVLNRAIKLRGLGVDTGKDFDSGLFLVREFLRSKPLSAEPRLAENQTIFWRISNQADIKADTMDELHKVSDSVEMLTRVDPDNMLWRREWAALQLIISGYATQNCMLNKAPLCQDKGLAMLGAERQNDEGVEQLRGLLGKDAENFSLRMDVANGLLGRANILRENNKTRERMQALDEAIQIYSQSIRDASDAESKSNFASSYLDRAEAWQDQGETAKALEDVRKAKTLYEGLTRENPNCVACRSGLVLVLSKEIEILGKTGESAAVTGLENQKDGQEKAIRQLAITIDAIDAIEGYRNPQCEKQMAEAAQAKKDNKPELAMAAYQACAQALKNDAQADAKQPAIWHLLATVQLDIAETLQASKRLPDSFDMYREAIQSARKSIELFPGKAEYHNIFGIIYKRYGDALQANRQLDKARDQFRKALEAWRAALRLKPTEPVYHRNMSEAYGTLSELDDAAGGSLAEQPGWPAMGHEWVLRQKLYATWKALAFSSDQERNKRYENLPIARRSLAKFLTFETQNWKESLFLMEQVLAHVEDAVRKNPKDPYYYCRLGDADYAIGLLRRQQSLPGWEESIRKGLLAIDWGIGITKEGLPACDDSFVCFKYSGGYRKRFAEFLRKDGREEEARQELDRALLASEKALKMCPTDEDVKRDLNEERKLLEWNP